MNAEGNTSQPPLRRARAWFGRPRNQIYSAAALLLLSGLAVLAFYPYDTTPGTVIGVSDVRDVRGADIGPETEFVADPSLANPSTPIVMVSPRGRSRVAVDVIRRGASRREEMLSFPHSPAEQSDWQLVRWDSDTAIARLSRTGRDIRVTVASLETRHRLFDRAVTLPVGAGRSFELVLTPSKGRIPNLLALEFGRQPPPNPFTGDQRTARIHVLSGSSGFREETALLNTPLRNLTASDWTLAVARIQGPQPDLLLINTPAGREAEVHVLTGETRFQRFIVQQRVRFGLGAEANRQLRFLPINRGTQASLAGIEVGDGRATIRIVPLVQN